MVNVNVYFHLFDATCSHHKLHFLLQIIGDYHVQLLSLDWEAARESEQGSLQVQTTYLLALNLSEPNVIKALQHPN